MTGKMTRLIISEFRLRALEFKKLLALDNGLRRSSVTLTKLPFLKSKLSANAYS